MDKSSVVIAIALACALAATATPFAKQTAIRGHVTDTGKAAIAGVHVKATNEKTKASISTETNADGDFSLSNLHAGIYDVTFLKDGFEFLLYPHVTVKKAEVVSLNVTVNRSSYTPPK